MDNNQKIIELKKIIPDVSRETIDDLLIFEQELKKWNQQINLISNNSSDIWGRHILDSAQLYPYLTNYNKIIDLGSGGGLPALILAILYKDKENFSIDLIEKLQKKCVFLQNIVAKLKLPANICNIRLENYVFPAAENIAVTSRAFASLVDILHLTKQWFAKNIVYFLQKGQKYQIELEQAQQNYQFSLDIYNSTLQKDSVILKIMNIKHIRAADK